jgi:hypothetical protein
MSTCGFARWARLPGTDLSGHSQVAATVTASPSPKIIVSAAQSHCGKASGVADIFPGLIAGKRILPLSKPGDELLPLQALRQGTHAAVDRLVVYAAVAAVMAVAVVVVVGQIRQMLVRRQLARRVTYDLLPSSSFDPTPEDVARFAHQLARTRPAVAWLRPRRGASIRIRLYTDDQGHLCYQLSGPASAGSVLRHQSYAQVELREMTMDGDLSPEGQITARPREDKAAADRRRNR